MIGRLVVVVRLETKFTNILAEHVSNRDLSHIDVMEHVKLPSKMTRIEGQQESLQIDIKLFGVNRDAAVLKVGSAETKLALLGFPRDIEHNCRMFNINASKTAGGLVGILLHVLVGGLVLSAILLCRRAR